MISSFKLLDSAYNKIKSYVKTENIHAFSLWKDYIGNSLVGIDIYADKIFIFIFELGEIEQIEEIKESLEKIFKGKVYLKDKTKKKDLFNRYAIGVDDVEDPTFIVEEYGAKFIIDPVTYLDVGLFLDHRESRQYIKNQAKDKKIANLFAYTGSFSVHAGLGGASLTHTVDLSKVYLKWARANLDLNNLPSDKHWTINMDTFEYFKYAQRKNLKFDIIVIDPPTFSKNKTENFSVYRDQYNLITEASKLLEEDGFIFFSNNFRDFEIDYRHRQLFNIQEITDQTIPTDYTHNHLEIPHRSYIIKLLK